MFLTTKYTFVPSLFVLATSTDRFRLQVPSLINPITRQVSPSFTRTECIKEFQVPKHYRNLQIITAVGSERAGWIASCARLMDHIKTIWNPTSNSQQNQEQSLQGQNLQITLEQLILPGITRLLKKLRRFLCIHNTPTPVPGRNLFHRIKSTIFPKATLEQLSKSLHDCISSKFWFVTLLSTSYKTFEQDISTHVTLVAVV